MEAGLFLRLSEGKPQEMIGSPTMRKSIALLAVVFLCYQPSKVGAFEKPYLDRLGQASSEMWISEIFIERCKAVSSRKFSIGDRVLRWDVESGISSMKRVYLQRRQCVDKLYPPALSAGWITVDEWEAGKDWGKSSARASADKFRLYLLENKVPSSHLDAGVCAIFLSNLTAPLDEPLC
jgi:hypothetical protein